MDRRTFLKIAAIGTVTSGLGAGVAAADRYFPTKVDQSLFDNINRVKDPAKKTPLEKSLYFKQMGLRKMTASWSFCPWHGVALEEKSIATPAAPAKK